MHNQNFCTISTTQLIPCCCSCALPSPPGSPVLSPLLIPKPQFPVNLFFSSFLSSFYFAPSTGLNKYSRELGPKYRDRSWWITGKTAWTAENSTYVLGTSHNTTQRASSSNKDFPPENVAQVRLSSWKVCTYTGRRIWAVQCPALQPHTLHGLCRCTQHTWHKEVTGVWQLWITFSQAANT